RSWTVHPVVPGSNGREDVAARDMRPIIPQSEAGRMPITITQVFARDIRFPTSRELDGSDAMNPDPDYSAAYAVLKTDHPAGIEGHGLTFTIGRGNELCVEAIRSLARLVLGRTLESFTS